MQTLACTCGDCRACAHDRPHTVQTAAVCSCGCSHKFTLILSIARHCGLTVASKHLVCTSIAALVYVCNPTIQFLGCFCVFLIVSIVQPLRNFALPPVQFQIVNKWWISIGFGPSAHGPSCLHCCLFVLQRCLWGWWIPSCPLSGVLFGTFHSIVCPPHVHTGPPVVIIRSPSSACPSEICTSCIRPP